MNRGALLVTSVVLGLFAGCSPCGSGFETRAYVADQRNSGEIVVPKSLGYFPATVEVNDGPGCNGANLACTEWGPDSPTCDSICISLNAKAHLPPAYGERRYLTLFVTIPGRPPKTTLTLPAPGVEATFILTEGSLVQEFPVTSGSVTPNVAQGRFEVEVEATAATPEGETISVHDGRYALVNGRYEAFCQLD